MAGDERDSGKPSSFKVQDRRRFSATGEARDEVEERETPPHPAEPAPRSTAIHGSDAAAPPPHEAHAHDHHAEHAHHHDAEHPHHHDAEITFASFVFSLSTQALVHLGEIPDPVDGATHVHLEGAQQIIDILAILSAKTKGNLDAAENALLEDALYDLRMRYVDRARRR